MSAQRKPSLAGIDSSIAALKRKLDDAMAVRSDAEEALESAQSAEVTQALMVEVEKELAKVEAQLETARTELVKAQTAQGIAEAACVTAEKNCAAAVAALAKEEADCEKAETGETAALVKVAGLEATIKQQAEELKVLRNKPATVTVTAPVQQAKKSGKQTVRATVRERDPNGRASVVDVVVQ